MNKQNKYYIFALLSFLILPSFLFAEELADSEINEKIEAFILEHPEVIVESINRYEKKMRSENDIRKQEFLQSNREMIFNTSDKMFEGNENGKIKLVEFFDYNCGYCKASHREIHDLLTEHQDLLVIYKPFPILGPLSLESAFKLSILTLMNTVNSSMHGLSDFNFQELQFFTKYYLIFFMIIGRVELLTLLIIFKKFLFKS